MMPKLISLLTFLAFLPAASSSDVLGLTNEDDVVSTLHHSSSTSSSAVSDFCSTPDLKSLSEWTTNIRAAVQKAKLPQAGDNRCNDDNSDNLPIKKVLFIGIDGLRAEAAGMLPLPAFRRLERMGTYSYWANVQSKATVKSGPGWTSMFTGVQPDKHLVDSNSDLTDISLKYPTVFKLVKDTYQSKKIAASVTWHPLIDEIIDHQDPNALDARFKAPNDDAMSEQAKEWILSKEYDFIFVDYDHCDATGHSKGFDAYLPEYRAAVQKTDGLIGELLDAVLTVSTDQEWLIILTSDHGGDGYDHGPQNEYNLRIPFLVASNSPRVGIGNVPAGDTGSQLDVLPTIMHFYNGGSCVDSFYEFKVKDSDGLKKYRDCSWVAKKDTQDRCNLKGVTHICPVTCQSCDKCKDTTLLLKFLDTTNGDQQAKKKCNWVKKEHKCNIDGMPNACRKTCSNCHPRYDVDGQVFGFVDYERRSLQCQTDPERCGCENIKQADYRGTIAETATGRLCQAWGSQIPHSHDRTPENYPSAGLEENYCRNPDGEPRAWCYTMDEDKRYELCNVTSCEYD